MMVRMEHPKPQFRRDVWQNLNGEWAFEFDPDVTGWEKGFADGRHPFSKTIQVPFCMESTLSGIGERGFMKCVWYRQTVILTAAQLTGRVRLHIGAADYETVLYMNGRECGRHCGGYASFFFDITDHVKKGENVITLQVLDDTRDKRIPSGKQSEAEASYGCFYTRTTGIWQTVWLEFLPATHLETVRYTTDIDAASVAIDAAVCGEGTLTVEAFYEGRPVGKAAASAANGKAVLTLLLSETHLWELGHGRLYDLVLTFGDDVVYSYVGLREAKLVGEQFLLNGRSVFQRLVLDQGYYPDGIYTAPSDEALAADIDRAMACGFNGARLHEKVFEERFLYHCDRKGYLVWGEYPNWGLDHTCMENAPYILNEWLSVIERDRNHPSIVGWCPFNETWDQGEARQSDELIASVYHATKAADPSRPCIDTSGNYHVVTDIFDLHDYDQDPAVFASHYAAFAAGGPLFDRLADRQTYTPGQPVMISEYGG
ncbi:MAG: beta-galactosidase, partial [Clostridia bacterium]|nr:beta-galactosidase [Clostridia bacterium]